MSRAQVLYLHACVVLTGATGLVFGVMKYLMKSNDEFSVVNHPLQPYMLSTHVAVAPFLVFGFGWMFGNHVWPKFRYGEVQKRVSGLWSMAAIVPMTLSGYFLQIATSEVLRTTMAAAHWIGSAIFVVAYVAHLRMRAGLATGRSGVEGDAVSVPSPT